MTCPRGLRYIHTVIHTRNEWAVKYVSTKKPRQIFTNISGGLIFEDPRETRFTCRDFFHGRKKVAFPFGQLGGK